MTMSPARVAAIGLLLLLPASFLAPIGAHGEESSKGNAPAWEDKKVEASIRNLLDTVSADVENAALTVRATLAALLTLDANPANALGK